MNSNLAKFIVVGVAVAFAANAQDGASLKAGFGRADITPAVGMQIPGGFSKNISKGVHDALFAEAVVIQSNDMMVALVGVDALFVPDDIVAEARKQIEAECSIPQQNILIAASHTHSGGPTTDCLGSERNPEYCQSVAAGIAEAVGEARANLVDARIGVGAGHEDTVGFNRRFYMKDGKVRTHPGKMNPDIVKPAGPIDPEVGVIALQDAEGRALGCIVNYALHATVIGGNQFSADWPGYMRATIRGGLGADVGVVFLNGACGDVTQVDNRSDGPREFGEAWARRIGTIVGAEALKAIAALDYTDSASLAVNVASLDLPVRDLADSDEALVARETPASGLGSTQNDAYLREAALVRAMKEKSPVARVEVQAMRIGAAAVVTNPTEYFCALGLAIKQRSPFLPTFVSELSNGYAGYVPTAEAFGEGGYEIRTARSSFLAPGTGEQIVDKSVELLNSIK